MQSWKRVCFDSMFAVMNTLTWLTIILVFIKTHRLIHVPGDHSFPLEHLQSLPEYPFVSIWLVCRSWRLTYDDWCCVQIPAVFAQLNLQSETYPTVSLDLKFVIFHLLHDMSKFWFFLFDFVLVLRFCWRFSIQTQKAHGVCAARKQALAQWTFFGMVALAKL